MSLNSTGTKKKPLKKKLKKKSFGIEHKPIVVGGLIAVVAISAIATGFIFIRYQGKEETTFILGIRLGPTSLDPLVNPWAWDETYMVYDQFAEGLFDFDIYSENSPVIYNLVNFSEWSADYLNLTCTLRHGVKFHDGSTFNASAVKWNIERIHTLTDNSDYKFLYTHSNGERIINDTIIIDPYTIRFVLNKSFIALKALLATCYSYILSPKSTPKNRYLDITEKPIGTGPFILDYCIYGVETVLNANPDYWDGKPLIDKVIFQTYDNDTERHEAMLAGDIHYTYLDLLEYFEVFKKNSNFNVGNLTSSYVWYISMNNDRIPVEMRKAISYAFNYTAYREKFYLECERVQSPLPEGMIYSHWGEFTMPNYNISIARQALKDEAWPNTSSLTADDDISPGNKWELIANSSNPLAIYNISIIFGWSGHAYLADLITKNLQQIGVKVETIEVTEGEFWDRLDKGRGDFFRVGWWGACYNDPYNNLNPLYSNDNKVYYNIFHFNDSLVQDWMDAAIAEPNKILREQLYYNIEERLIETLYPVIWLFTGILFGVTTSNLKSPPEEGYPFKFLLKDFYFA